jgi:hypothetical protein
VTIDERLAKRIITGSNSGSTCVVLESTRAVAIREMGESELRTVTMVVILKGREKRVRCEV